MVWRTVNLAAMVAWYDAALGIKAGHRPDFPVPGAWLYLGEACVLHLIEADPAPMVHAEGESLRMEHIAFRAEGMADFLANLKRIGTEYRLFPFDSAGIVLVFLRDPDGNRLHIDFTMAEYEALPEGAA